MDLNLLINISRCTNFVDFVSFIHVSRRVRQLFLFHLVEIVDHVLKATITFDPHSSAPVDLTQKLPRWMTMTLPLAEIPRFSALNDRILNTLRERHPYLYDPSRYECEHPALISGPFLLSGGSVAQIATESEWPSDLDIFSPILPSEHLDEDRYISSVQWHPEKRLRSNIVDVDGNALFYFELDWIRKKTDPIQWVLSDFDLSICQVGVLFSPDDQCVFVTPLFLYSLHNRVLVAQVSDLTARYKEDFNVKPQEKVILHEFFEKHCVLHLPGRFDQCDSCYFCADNLMEHDPDPSGAKGIGSDYMGSDQNYVKRWIRRVRKYVKRFPDWSVKFIKA